MNDEFLHRIRKTPPPEFLAELKTRLDRQSSEPARRNRWSFTRGLITGLLLGGAAFALTAVSLTRGPESLRSLARTPAEYFARFIAGRNSGQEDDQTQAHGEHRAVPLGPVWLPDRAAGPSGQASAVPTQPTGFAVKQEGHPDPVSSRAPNVGSSSAAGGGVSQVLSTITVAASSDAYPIALAVANRVPRYAYHVNVELDAGDIFDKLCGTDSTTPVEVVELSRRITPDELRRCARGGNKLVEIKVGYLAIVLARAPLYGPLHLTARDLFLALARRIPDPAHPEKFINNPTTTWNQVDGSLPYDRIQLLGPDPGSVAGKLVAHLLLQGGCNTYQSIMAIHDSDPEGYENICGTLRADGAYVQSDLFAGSNSNWAYSDLFVINPTQIGVFAPNDPGRSRNNLAISSVETAEPAPAGLTAGTYSVAETLYLYTDKTHLFATQAFMAFVNASLARGPHYFERDTWAFVPLETAERNSSLANAMALKELQF